MNFAYWNDLAAELKIHILSYLCLRDLSNFARYSVLCHALSLDEGLWHDLYDDTFSIEMDQGEGLQLSTSLAVCDTGDDGRTDTAPSWREKFKADVLLLRS